jgi:DNA polymerase III epsilon subunit-like protein
LRASTNTTPARVAVLDLETNGFSANRASVVEFAALVLDVATDVVLSGIDRFYFAPEGSSREAESVHGLDPNTIAHLRAANRKEYAPTFGDDWPDVLDFLNRAGVEGYVIHNASFDCRFLPAPFLQDRSVCCTMRGNGIAQWCAIEGAKGRYKNPRLEELIGCLRSRRASLSVQARDDVALMDAYAENQHSALYDCLMLSVAFRALRRQGLATFRPGSPDPSVSPLKGASWSRWPAPAGATPPRAQSILRFSADLVRTLRKKQPREAVSEQSR